MNLIKKKIGCILSFTLILSSCSSPYSADFSKQVFKTKEKLINSAHRNKLIASASSRKKIKFSENILNALSPSKGKGSYYKPQEKYSISLSHLNAAHFFSVLSGIVNKNFVVNPSVHGYFSLHLKDVTLNQILDLLEKQYALSITDNSFAYEVNNIQLESKMFYLPHLALERSFAKSSSTSSSEESSSLGGGGVSVGHSGGIYYKQLIATVTSIIEMDYKLAKQRRKLARHILQQNIQSKKIPKGAFTSSETDNNIASPSASLNKQTGILLVTALPSGLKKVKKFIKFSSNLDNKQIIVEAEIVEVTLNHTHQFGINWSSIYGAYSGGSISGQLANGSNAFGSIFSLHTPSKGQSSEDGESDSDSIDQGFNVAVRALASQGKVSVVSNPRIMTLNGHPAVIKVGTTQQFVSGVSSTTSSNLATNTTSNSTDFSEVFSGLTVSVIPRVGLDNNILLYIHPLIQSVAQKPVTILSSGGKEETVETPEKKTRETDDIIKVNSGQTVVIGGLTETSSNNNNASVPGHGLISNLLAKKETGTSRRDLVIFVKAIIAGGKDLNRQIYQAANSLRN